MFSNRLTSKTSLLKKLQLFDYFVIGLFLLFGLAFFIFFFRENKYLTVKVKITEKNVLYAFSTPPSWFVYLFKQGMVKKDGLGRVNAEISDVYYYDTSPSTKAVYLTLRLRVTYNSRSQSYTYEGTPVAVGEGLRVSFGKILADGLIVSVEGLDNPYEEVYLRVKARLIENPPNFSETTGIESYIGEAIKVGDKIFDSQGKMMAELLDKKVLSAQKSTFDDRGNVYQRFDPRKEDVFLTLKVRAQKTNDELYFFDDVRIKVNEQIPLHFKTVSIYPVITEILAD